MIPFSIIKWGIILTLVLTVIYFSIDIVKTYQEKAELKEQVLKLSSVIQDKNSRIVFLEKDIKRREKLLVEAKRKEIELEREMRNILQNLPKDLQNEAPESLKELFKRLKERDKK